MMQRSTTRCPQCSFVAVDEEALSLHVAFGHESALDSEASSKRVKREESQVCSQCGSRFAGTYELELHITYEHAAIKCRHCGKELAGKEELQLHLKYEHAPSSSPARGSSACDSLETIWS